MLAASIFQKSLPASAQSSFRAPAAANAKCSQINETIIFESSAACRGFVGDQPKVPKTARTIVGVSSNCLRHCSRNWSTYVLAHTTPQNHCFYMHQGDTLRDHVSIFFDKNVSEQNDLWYNCFSMFSGSRLLEQRTMPLRGTLPETIGKHKAQRTFCSETFLTKNSKNVIAQNITLVHIKQCFFKVRSAST